MIILFLYKRFEKIKTPEGVGFAIPLRMGPL